MKNKVISFLLAVLIVALFLFLMLPSAHKQALDNKEMMDKKSLDSLKVLFDEMRGRDSLLVHENKDLKSTIKKIEKKAAFWQLQYEDLKNRPVPHLSDAGIDSALVRLYGTK